MGATPGGTRASTADKEEGHSKAGEATRTAGTGNQNGADGRAWRQRQQTGWPGQPAPSLPGARATPAQPASGGGCLPQPRWAVCATGAGAHQGQASREGEKDIWWTAGTTRGGTGHLGLTHRNTARQAMDGLWTEARGQQKQSNDPGNNQHILNFRQLLGAADAQTAHHATFSTAPTHQLLGSVNAETTPARAPATAAGRKQQPDATCKGKNGLGVRQVSAGRKNWDSLRKLQYSRAHSAWKCPCSLSHCGCRNNCRPHPCRRCNSMFGAACNLWQKLQVL